MPEVRNRFNELPIFQLEDYARGCSSNKTNDIHFHTQLAELEAELKDEKKEEDQATHTLRRLCQLHGAQSHYHPGRI